VVVWWKWIVDMRYSFQQHGFSVGVYARPVR
jgi:hypothetical protein